MCSTPVMGRWGRYETIYTGTLWHYILRWRPWISDVNKGARRDVLEVTTGLRTLVVVCWRWRLAWEHWWLWSCLDFAHFVLIIRCKQNHVAYRVMCWRGLSVWEYYSLKLFFFLLKNNWSCSSLSWFCVPGDFSCGFGLIKILHFWYIFIFSAGHAIEIYVVRDREQKFCIFGAKTNTN